MSLMDTYRELASLDEADEAVVEQEQAKIAEDDEAVGEVIKTAQDYEESGRRLARVMYGSWKVAADMTERKEEEEGMENKPSGPAPSEKEDEEKDKAKKRKKEGDGEEQVAEKKASILSRANEDPEFRARLLEWHTGQSS